MHPSFAPWIGKRVVLTMAPGAPWYGHRIAGTLTEPPESAPESSVKLTHDRAGDVILLPAAVAGVRQAKASE